MVASRGRWKSLLFWGPAGAGAFAAALIATFLLVTQWSGGNQPQALDPVRLAEAQLLRTLDNRLAGLVEGYLSQVALDSLGPSPAAEAWIQRTFLALAREFQEDLDRSGLPASPAADALRASAARLISMAKHSRDRALRLAVVQEARRAIDAGEARIDALNARSYMGEPARVLGF